MALSSARRDAIRSEYQDGAFVRALARRHGVHESSIREMARKQNWTRDRQAAERIRQANLPTGLDGIAAKYFPRRPAFQRPASSHAEGPAHEACPEEVATAIRRAHAAIAQAEANAKAEIARATARARAEIGEAVIKAKAEAMARINLETIERVEKLEKLFDRLIGLLLDFMQVPEDDAGRERQAEAKKILLPGHRDRLSSHLGQAGTLLMRIQTVTRKALGLDRPNWSAPTSTPSDAEPPAAEAKPPAKPAPDLAFFQSLTTEELRTLWLADRIMAGQHRPPPHPMPPDDPSKAASNERPQERRNDEDDRAGSGRVNCDTATVEVGAAVGDDTSWPVPPDDPLH